MICIHIFISSVVIRWDDCFVVPTAIQLHVSPNLSCNVTTSRISLILPINLLRSVLPNITPGRL